MRQKGVLESVNSTKKIEKFVIVDLQVKLGVVRNQGIRQRV